MPRAKYRRSSRGGRRASGLWETNGIEPTHLASGQALGFNILDGVNQPETLKKVAIRRLIMELNLATTVASSNVALEMVIKAITRDSFVAGAWPEIADDTAPMFARIFDHNADNNIEHSTWQFDMKFNYRYSPVGNDNIMVFRNPIGAGATLNFNMNFRMYYQWY